MKNRIIGIIFGLFCLVCFIMPASAAESDDNTTFSYIVSDGSVYYESSYGFGSGRHGIVNDTNRYTPTPCYAAINGYSFLDEQGNIIIADYDESTNDITIPSTPDTAFKLFVHFKTNNYRNGWVDYENILPRTSSQSSSTPAVATTSSTSDVQNPQEVVKNIEKVIQSDQKTAIVIDYSASMYDNQREVVDLLALLNFDDTYIIVFADYYKTITHEQLIAEDFNVGLGTHMMQALNQATSYGIEDLIIISDLDTYGDVALNQSDTLKHVLIYDPDNESEPVLVDDTLRKIWDQATIAHIKIA